MYDELTLCASCLTSYPNWEGEECPYAEDWFCYENDCFNKHMHKKHYLYWRHVIYRITQHKSRDKYHAQDTLKKFERNGRVILTEVYFVEEVRKGNKGGWKFDYHEMSRDQFMITHFNLDDKKQVGDCVK